MPKSPNCNFLLFSPFGYAFLVTFFRSKVKEKLDSSRVFFNDVSMRTITLVRHGETSYNREARITGHHNPSLTERGFEQAESLSKHFNQQSMVFDYVYSSDLKRAYSTALHAVQHQDFIAFEMVDLLREKTCGDYDGKLKSELFAHIELGKHRNDPDYKLPNGESFLCVVKRAEEFIEQHVKGTQKDKKNILVVSHAVTTRALLVALGEMSVEDAMNHRIDNATPITLKLKP